MHGKLKQQVSLSLSNGIWQIMLGPAIRQLTTARQFVPLIGQPLYYLTNCIDTPNCHVWSEGALSAHARNYELYAPAELSSDALVTLDDGMFICSKLDVGEPEKIWTSNLTLKLVQMDWTNLEFVEEQTLELCTLAIQQNKDALNLVKDPKLKAKLMDDSKIKDLLKNSVKKNMAKSVGQVVGTVITHTTQPYIGPRFSKIVGDYTGNQVSDATELVMDQSAEIIEGTTQIVTTTVDGTTNLVSETISGTTSLISDTANWLKFKKNDKLIYFTCPFTPLIKQKPCRSNNQHSSVTHQQPSCLNCFVWHLVWPECCLSDGY